MKRITLVIWLLFLVLCNCSTLDRGTPDKIFESHDNTEGTVYISLPPNMAKKYVKPEFESNKEVKEVLEQIEVFKALSIKKKKAIIDIDSEITAPIKDYSVKKDMKELLNVTNQNFHVSIQISESEGQVDELLFTLDNKEIYTGVFLKGNITLQNILAIIKHVDFNKMEDSFSFDF